MAGMLKAFGAEVLYNDVSKMKQEDENALGIKFSTREEIIEKSVNRIGSLNKYHIWTRDHVSSYLDGNKAKIWLLRVYKLDKPILTKRSNGMVFANTNKKISLTNMKPVISDVEFNKIKEDIIG